jgi:S-DNA-T family DNA segregation ATPase FtsK/SpoIIIE
MEEKLKNTLTDSLFHDAAALVVKEQIASTSFLQRRLKLGYNKAYSLLYAMEELNIVGPGSGIAAPRVVLCKTADELGLLFKD